LGYDKEPLQVGPRGSVEEKIKQRDRTFGYVLVSEKEQPERAVALSLFMMRSLGFWEGWL